jgi:hypothetical protein
MNTSHTQSIKTSDSAQVFLRGFIREVIKMEDEHLSPPPVVGQHFKSTRYLPITMPPGRDIEVTDVRASSTPGAGWLIDFSILGHDNTVYGVRTP